MRYRRPLTLVVTIGLLLPGGASVALAASGGAALGQRLAGAAAPPAPPAHSTVTPLVGGPSHSTTLQVDASQMVVDDAHSHVFLVGSSGTQPGVAVMNFDGTLDTMIPISGASREALDTSTGILYVSRESAAEIDAIDTSSLTVTDTFPLPAPGNCPSDLAISSSLVWYSSDCADITNVGIGELDPSDGSSQYFQDVAGPFHVSLVASPALPNVLFAGMDQDEPPTLWKFDTTGGTLTQLATMDTHFLGGSGYYLEFLGASVTPDGQDLLYPSYDTVYTLKTSDLTLDTDAYPGGTYTDAGASSPDGAYVATGNSDPYPTFSVAVYPAHSTTADATFLMGTDTPMVAKGELAFSGDGGKLFAVAFDYGGPYAFEVFDGAQYPPGTLTISVSSHAPAYLGKVTVTAHLTDPPTTDDRQLTITEHTALGGTSAATGTMSGSQSWSHVFQMHRTSTFTASWNGDETHGAAAKSSSTVTVGSRTSVALLKSYKNVGGYHLYHYSAQCVNTHSTGCPHIQGTVTPSNAGSTVCFTTQEYLSGAWGHSVKLCGSLGSLSKATIVVYYTSRGIIGVPARTQVHFQGSSANRASTSGWGYFKITS